MNTPLISIIIICENWNQFLEESIQKYSQLNYPNFETFLFSTEKIDKTIQDKFPNIKFINDKQTKNNPAGKRDLSIKYAKGTILAFIDDDAYPEKDWLKNAVINFDNKDIIAVGGPGITPSNAGILEKASGLVSASPLGGFGNTYRFIPQNKRYIDDYPSMNFLVKADVFKKIKGFDSNYYPGEDTKLCLDLIQKTGKKIIYDPDVIVYHHKRPLFKKHLIQNGRFGLHRGNFARILPETSRRIFYFIPSLFSIGIISGIIFIIFKLLINNSNILNLLVYTYIFTISIYKLLLILNAIWVYIQSKSIKISLLSIPGTFLTHFWYGIRFIQGYLSNSMNDKYGRTEN